MKKYKKIAYSFVMADLLHYGHLRLLKTAEESADYHICGVISDEACHLWQGVNICNYEERKTVVDSLDCVDEVMKQDSIDPTENLKVLRKRFPDSQIIVIHGSDWNTMPGKDYIENIGGKIIQPKYYKRLARSTIIEKFTHPAIDNHPLKHEYFSHHFRIGNISQFQPPVAHPLVSTKANTLKKFSALLKLSRIEEIFICTVEDFRKYSKDIVKTIQKQFKNKRLVIRSSSLSEDCYGESNAGRYHSVKNVDCRRQNEIISVINRILQSYRKQKTLRNEDQILVQTQTLDVKKSGVIFTRNLETNTPYYFINYDDQTEETDAVTGGKGGKSIWIFRDRNLSEYPKDWRKILASVQEIESHLPGMVLDIEFAEKKNGEVVIYQVRPLVANVRVERSNDRDFKRMIEENITKYRELKRIGGSRLFFSDMAFWNPSEIIGDNTHPLDYSLYREIITKSAWNEGIRLLGYTPVKHELMEKYANKPYINLNHTFLGLIPNSLKEGLKKKLIDFYLSKLKKNPSAHDKIEFEIVYTCYDFGLDRRLRELLDNGFTSKEVKEINIALKDLTLANIAGYNKLLKTVRKDLMNLELKRKEICKKQSNLTTFFDYIDFFLTLIKDISTYGTPQFSTIAREAFISQALCKSLVSEGFFSEIEMSNFMESMQTIAKEFNIDFRMYVAGKVSKKKFMTKYGHLRTGSYDIIAQRYDQLEFIKHPYCSEEVENIEDRERFSSSLDEEKLGKILKASPFSSLSSRDFLHFIKSAIEEREYFKFEFTKSLSLALELLAKAGEILGFSKEEIAYLDIPTIKAARLYSNQSEIIEFWRALIHERKSSYLNYSRIVLPAFIQNDTDFKFIYSFEAKPNFITQKCLKGEVIDLERNRTGNLKGKIVLLRKADPGFDWIFTRQIGALVTKYGGAGSHMAIRCAEFGIPAAIGCGDQIYNKISRWSELKLDCKRRKILPF